MVGKLELRDLRKCFDQTEAVSGLSLALQQGEFVSLLGPSGCGKSTTLAMVAGLVQPDDGEILIDGKLVNAVSPQKRGVGLVFQDYAVFSRMSVEENLSFGLEVKAVPRAERKVKVKALAEQLGLDAILSKRAGKLNMSEMQRVALARAMIVEPSLLLLDEPMSNLDASVRGSLRSELRQIQRTLGQTVFYVTHDQAEALSMSDRIAIMRDGKLLQVGTPDDIYMRPRHRFIAEFIGDPPINVVACDIQADADDAMVGLPATNPIIIPHGGLPTGKHLLGIRPHNILLKRGPSSGFFRSRVRFVENFGSEHVLHLEYGDDLIRVTAGPGFAGSGETVYAKFELEKAHVIESATGRVIQLSERFPSTDGKARR